MAQQNCGLKPEIFGMPSRLQYPPFRPESETGARPASAVSRCSRPPLQPSLLFLEGPIVLADKIPDFVGHLK